MARTFLTADTEYLYNNSPPVTAAAFSVSCWYYYTASINQAIFSLADKDVSNHYWLLYATNSDKLFWFVTEGGSTGQTGSMAATTNANEWNHAGAIEVTSGSRACFMNGEKQISGHDRSPANIDQFALGVRCSSDYDIPFGGKLAEFGWWNVALTDAEMGLLNLGYSPLLIRPQSLVAYIPLVRDADEDLIGGLSMSVAGTPTIGTHVPVIYPGLNRLIFALATPVAPPDAPTSLTATAISSTEIDLAWTDNSDDEDGFKIERSPDGSTWAQIDTEAAEAESYSDTGLDPNTLYYYRVRAYNGAGNSAYTNTASAKTPPDDVTLQQYLVWNGSEIQQTDYRYVALVDGVPEPDTVAGVCWIYIDEDDGDMKAKFGDGTVKTITADT